MAVVIKHKKHSNKPDGTDESVVRPSDWNEDHAVQMTGPALVGKSDTGNGDAVEITVGDGLKLDGDELKIDPDKQYVSKTEADQLYAAADSLEDLGNAHNSFVTATNQALADRILEADADQRYATKAQGLKADSAVQPDDLAEALQGVGSSLENAPLRQVGGRTGINNFKNTIPQLSGCKFLPIYEEIGPSNPLRLRFSAIYVNGSNNASPDWKETGTGAPTSIRLSIEHPPGVFTRIKFNNQDTGSIPEKSWIWTDDITVPIKPGSLPKVWFFMQNPNGCVYHNATCVLPGEGLQATGGVDLTAAGGVIAQSVGSSYGPDLAVAKSWMRAGLISGDSIAVGVSSYAPTDPRGVCGVFSRPIATKMANANIACGGDRSDLFLEDSAYRQSFLPYFTDFYCNYGYNNLVAGSGGKLQQTASEALASLQSMANMALAAGLRYWQSLITPVQIISTNAYTTPDSQTPSSATYKARRITLNRYLRKNAIKGMSGYVDPTTLYETAYESNVVKVEPTGRTITDYTVTQGSNIVGSATANFTENDSYTRLQLIGFTNSGNFGGFMKFLSANQITVHSWSQTGDEVAANSNKTGGVVGGTAYLGAYRNSSDGVHLLRDFERELEASAYMAHCV